MPEAIRHTNRAYFFDTSKEQARHFAELTDGTQIELKGNRLPPWFKPIWEQFGQKSSEPPAA
jgi:hypothetical protein